MKPKNSKTLSLSKINVTRLTTNSSKIKGGSEDGCGCSGHGNEISIKVSCPPSPILILGQ